MKIAFFSNFINHHQSQLADELYRLTNGNYYFIETIPMPEWLKSGGYADFSSKPYLIKAWQDRAQYDKAMEIALNVDVVLFGGSEVLPFINKRAKEKLFSIEISERKMKRGWINILSPTLIKMMASYYLYFRKAPFYKLCSSAYGALDESKLGAYKNKCFKWGYFTKVDKFDIVKSLRDGSRTTNSLMWCARFLKWKHPEMPVLLAKKLKDNGHNFSLDMYGTGVQHENIIKLAQKLGVSEHIKFKGNVPNADIINAMRRHSIFLFTSDSNEGWGAVANEAMSNGCAFVGSDKIGSVPYLVNDGVNGMIFKSEDIDSLYEKVIYLIDNPTEREKMALSAYEDMCNIWSPTNAAKNLIQLIEDLQNNRPTSIEHGPCGVAPILI